MPPFPLSHLPGLILKKGHRVAWPESEAHPLPVALMKEAVPAVPTFVLCIPVGDEEIGTSQVEGSVLFPEQGKGLG